MGTSLFSSEIDSGPGPLADHQKNGEVPIFIELIHTNWVDKSRI